MAIFVPDTTREDFEPTTRHGGHDGEDGRSLRYIEWLTDPDPADSIADTDFVLVLREPGKPLHIEHDHRVFGLFSDSTWRDLLREAGLELVDPGVEDPYAGEHSVFVARKAP